VIALLFVIAAGFCPLKYLVALLPTTADTLEGRMTPDGDGAVPWTGGAQQAPVEERPPLLSATRAA